MNLNEEQLKEIENMASLFFTSEEIAQNLELEGDRLDYFVDVLECRNISNPIYKSYVKGRLSSEVELRKSIRQSALNGSSPSQQMMLTFNRESR